RGDDDTVGAGFRQPGDDVSCHERMAFVGDPPTPAAIFMLEVVEAIESGLDLLVELGLVDWLLESQLVDSLGDDDIGQETGHRLFHAAIRKRRQIFERTEERPRNGRREANRKRARTGNGIGREGEAKAGRAGVCDGATARLTDAYAGRIDWELHFQRVRFFIGKRLRRDLRAADGVRLDTSVD